MEIVKLCDYCRWFEDGYRCKISKKRKENGDECDTNKFELEESALADDSVNW